MAQTPNYNFPLTPSTEAIKTTVYDWQQQFDGEASDSTLNLIDGELKRVENNSKDIYEFDLKENLPAIGIIEKKYIVYSDTKENNGQYRWTGSEYAIISQSSDSTNIIISDTEPVGHREGGYWAEPII